MEREQLKDKMRWRGGVSAGVRKRGTRGTVPKESFCPGLCSHLVPITALPSSSTRDLVPTWPVQHVLHADEGFWGSSVRANSEPVLQHALHPRSSPEPRQACTGTLPSHTGDQSLPHPHPL